MLPTLSGEQPFNVDISPQPFISDLQPNEYTVMVDNTSIVTCEDKALAVTALFASYWIFDIKYAASHKRALELLEKAIFKISSSKPSQALQRVLNSL